MVLRVVQPVAAATATLAVPLPQEPCVAALARVERTDFLSPMCIGEVANVSAEITYTSRHSVEVQVNVMSENILTGGWLPAALSQNSRNNRDKPRAHGSGPALRPPSPAALGRGDILPLLRVLGAAGRGGAGKGSQAASLGITAPLIIFSKEGKNLLLTPPLQFAARGCLGLKKALFLLLLWQPAPLAWMPSQKRIVTSARSQSSSGAGRAGSCPVPAASPACSQPRTVAMPAAGEALLVLAWSPSAPLSSRGEEGDEQGNAVVRPAVPEEREQGPRGSPHPGRMAHFAPPRPELTLFGKWH